MPVTRAQQSLRLFTQLARSSIYLANSCSLCLKLGRFLRAGWLLLAAAATVPDGCKYLYRGMHGRVDLTEDGREEVDLLHTGSEPLDVSKPAGCY